MSCGPFLYAVQLEFNLYQSHFFSNFLTLHFSVLRSLVYHGCLGLSGTVTDFSGASSSSMDFNASSSFVTISSKSLLSIKSLSWYTWIHCSFFIFFTFCTIFLCLEGSYFLMLSCVMTATWSEINEPLCVLSTLTSPQSLVSTKSRIFPELCVGYWYKPNASQVSVKVAASRLFSSLTCKLSHPGLCCCCAEIEML